jgi:cell volume regulation protein A
MRIRTPIPAPALLLAGAAAIAAAIPGVGAPDRHVVEWIVSVALIAILFDGGMQIGRRRAVDALGSVLSLGLAGTVATTASVALLAHYGFHFSWYVAGLIATAVAPTDPAVVFSVLGGRDIEGRSGTILKGESGANDPVGIALMVSLIAAKHLSSDAIGPILGRFALQLAVGTVIGIAAGELLRWLHRRHPIVATTAELMRTGLIVGGSFALAYVAHGSGFLAVFLAGGLLGDDESVSMTVIRRGFDWASSAGEVVAFVTLGLTVSLDEIAHRDVWGPGLLIAAVLTLAIRPAVAELCLLRSRLRPGERAFIAFAGLKGAVPILLGSLLLGAPVSDGPRYYSMIVVIVMVSVVIPGSLVPRAASVFRVPMSAID